MTRNQAIITYKARAKTLLDYKRQVAPISTERAYKALAMAQYCNAYARFLSELHPLDYIYMNLDKRAKRIAASKPAKAKRTRRIPRKQAINPDVIEIDVNQQTLF